MSSITAIDKESIHQICSGQVILDLSSALKELIENSIDANSTKIDVTINNYGINCLQDDNGKGINEEDFQQIALKHYTSKLKDFDNLKDLNTLGFRGEALSSLCAVSNVEIITKISNNNIPGYHLKFDTNGTLIEQKTQDNQVLQLKLIIYFIIYLYDINNF